jgi:MFS family permease
MVFFASAAASPLYRVYQAQFRFSAAALTAVFAVYVLVLLATLLVFGPVSDYLGRLPVTASTCRWVRRWPRRRRTRRTCCGAAW